MRIYLSAEKCKTINKIFKEEIIIFKDYLKVGYEKAVQKHGLGGTLKSRFKFLIKSKVKRNWAFSNLVSIVRQQLMNYINIYRFLEDPEGSWREIVKENKLKYQNTLFPKL